MTSRLVCSLAALVLSLQCAALSAQVAVGQEATPAENPAPTETPTDLRVDETKQGTSAFQALRDFGSFGPAFGLTKLWGGDLGSESKVRPVWQGVFRYRFNDDWVGVGEFGFTWSSFEAREDTVLTVAFGTLGVARKFLRAWQSDLRWLAGGGMYRWKYRWHGDIMRDRFRDPAYPDSVVYAGSMRYYQGFVPGLYVGVEGERRLTRHVTLTANVQQHYMFIGDDKFEQFFDSNYGSLGFRMGLNYHFSPEEGILWERKQRNVIRLESGQESK